MFQSDDPWPIWKMNTTIPKAAERDEVEDGGLDRQHDRAEGTRQQDERQDEHEREYVREVAVDGVHEVAVDGGHAAERRICALEHPVDPVDHALDSGRRAVDGREGLDERVLSAMPAGRHGG